VSFKIRAHPDKKGGRCRFTSLPPVFVSEHVLLKLTPEEECQAGDLRIRVFDDR